MKLAQISFPYSGLESATGLTGFSDLGSVVTKLLPYVFAIAGLILLLNLVYGGISLMLSGGDPKAVESAKNRITSSLIGFIIIFTAYWLVQIIGRILGIEIFKRIFM